jgi:hypothetical protein
LYGCQTWFITVREEEILRVFENRLLEILRVFENRLLEILRVFENRLLEKISGLTKDEAPGVRKKIHNEKLFYFNSTSIVNVII